MSESFSFLDDGNGNNDASAFGNEKSQLDYESIFSRM